MLLDQPVFLYSHLLPSPKLAPATSSSMARCRRTNNESGIRAFMPCSATTNSCGSVQEPRSCKTNAPSNQASITSSAVQPARESFEHSCSFHNSRFTPQYHYSSNRSQSRPEFQRSSLLRTTRMRIVCARSSVSCSACCHT